ncbi:MAG: glycosyltransferase family 4 protein, partial [Parcubacteria group bacterium]|nr:glycosyltransferase family 4 protein [Parcubacteria group bacterium]
PETNAPANRWGYFCDYLTQRGHEVFVLTSFPNHPLRKIFPNYKNAWCYREEKNGIKIIRTWTYISSSIKFLPRLLNYLSFAFSSYWNSKKIPPVDLIIISLPPIFIGFTGLRIVRQRNIPVILDIRDLWPEAAESTGYIKKGFIYQLFKQRAKNLYQKANCLIVNSPALKKHLVTDYAVSANKIVYISNGVDFELFSQEVDTSFVERQYNLFDTFVVSYIGLLGFAQNLEVIIETAQLLKDNKDIKFLIVGVGPLEQKLKVQVKKLKLDNIIFTGLIPHNEINQYIGVSDICLIPYKNDPVFKENIPSKMFEYMAAKKPIIINLEGEASRMIQEAQAGILVKPNDPLDLKTLFWN